MSWSSWRDVFRAVSELASAAAVSAAPRSTSFRPKRWSAFENDSQSVSSAVSAVLPIHWSASLLIVSSWNTIALPYARHEEVTNAIRSHLSEVSIGHPYRTSWPEVERITGRELSVLDLDPEDRAPRRFACYGRVMHTPHDLAVFVEMDGRWDLGLASALSRATGGFAVAAESWRFMGRYGLALFYAGALVQAWGFDCEGSDELVSGPPPTPTVFDVDAAFRRMLASIMSLDALTINRRSAIADATVVDLVTDNSERSSFEPHLAPPTIPVTSVFFADVSPKTFEDAVHEVGVRGGWSVEHTAYGVPYGLLVGSAAKNDELWVSLQRRLETAALRLIFDSHLPVAWEMAGHFFSMERGEARDARELIDVLRVFAEIMKAQPGDLKIVAS